MSWNIKEAKIKGDIATITLSQVLQEAVPAVEAVVEVVDEAFNVVTPAIAAVAAAEEVEDTQVLRHYRTAFNGRLQTLDEWRANIRREVQTHLNVKNTPDPIEEDITKILKRS